MSARSAAPVHAGPSAGPRVLPPRLEVWRLDFDPSAPLADDLAVLSRAERARATTMLFPQDRRRFVMCRAFLRRVLGSYGHQAPEDVVLSVGPHGKLAWRNGRDSLGFNLSRSHHTCLVAAMHGFELGVDVEERHRVPERSGLARAYLTRQEQATLAGAPLNDRDDLFLRFWTRKEAILKAAGVGLSVAPTRFEVNALQPIETVRFDGHRLGAEGLYRVIDLSRDGLIAAAAVRHVDGPVTITERHFDTAA